MADARRLAELGMVPILAKEVAAQITAGVANTRRLVEFSMIPRVVREFQTQLTNKVYSVRRFTDLGVSPQLAKELVTQIQGGGQSPDLDVNFLTGGTIPGATFARAGAVATRRNPSALIENVAADTMRFNYDGSGAAMGLLVERLMSSSLLQSGELGTTWSVSGVTVTANQAVGPTGAAEMDQADEGVTNARHMVFQSAGVNNTAQTTFCGFVKDVDRRYLQLTIASNGGSGTIYAYYDLQTGTVTDSGVASATATFGSAGIISFGNGIFFIWLTGKITGTLAYHQIAMSDRSTHTGTLSGGVPSYLGTNKKLLLWGFDSITSPFPLSYIPTTTTSATRNADIYTDALFGAFSGRIIINARTGRGAFGNQTLWNWDDWDGAVYASRLTIRRTSDKHLHCVATISGVDQCDLDLGVVDDFTSFKVEFAWGTNAFSAKLNDGAAVTDTSGAVPPDRKISRYGSSFTAGEEWCGHIEKITRYDDVPSSALRLEGDSYVAATPGALKLSLRANSSRLVACTGQGGSDIAGASSRLQSAAFSKLRPVTLVFWDGSPNPLQNPVVPADITAYCDTLAAGLAALGHNRFVLIPAAAGGSVGTVEVGVAIRDAFLARWPNNTLDWRPFIPNTGGAINADQFQGDNVHLLAATVDVFTVNGIFLFLAAKGW